MATNDSGFNEIAAEDAIQNIIDTEADIHLLTEEPNIATDEADIQSKSGAVETVPESGFTINTASSFSDTTKLELNQDVNFGSLDIGVVTNVAVVGSSDRVIVGLENNQPNLTGENFTLDSGEVLYEIGNA